MKPLKAAAMVAALNRANEAMRRAGEVPSVENIADAEAARIEVKAAYAAWRAHVDAVARR